MTCVQHEIVNLAPLPRSPRLPADPRLAFCECLTDLLHLPWGGGTQDSHNIPCFRWTTKWSDFSFVISDADTVFYFPTTVDGADDLPPLTVTQGSCECNKSRQTSTPRQSRSTPISTFFLPFTPLRWRNRLPPFLKHRLDCPFT
ncbi:hypothetical protein IAQ61_010459 [Plenodomus lingam]|uniref:uncharacterized protein n=1 Tax=Leptosphaeria maculans TaxID=5022 RepID=UPI003328C464|nr:hypothetical protein IAQ61_010459 [Plenodomus lingam]